MRTFWILILSIGFLTGTMAQEKKKAPAGRTNQQNEVKEKAKAKKEEPRETSPARRSDMPGKIEKRNDWGSKADTIYDPAPYLPDSRGGPGYNPETKVCTDNDKGNINGMDIPNQGQFPNPANPNGYNDGNLNNNNGELPERLNCNDPNIAEPRMEDPNSPANRNIDTTIIKPEN